MRVLGSPLALGTPEAALKGATPHPASRQKTTDPALRKAAEGMEAMFIDTMMQAMRKTVGSNEMDLESPATAIYRSMQDSELAQQAARQGGVGLADMIVAYWEAQGYNQRQAPDAKNPGKNTESLVHASNAGPTGPARESGPLRGGGEHEGE